MRNRKQENSSMTTTLYPHQICAVGYITTEKHFAYANRSEVGLQVGHFLVDQPCDSHAFAA